MANVMGIGIEESITGLVRRLKRRGLYTDTANLYAEGIKGKFRLARHCVEMLGIVEPLNASVLQVNSESSTWEVGLNDEDQIQLYCECLWHLLRSTIDMLSQLINEVRVLGIPERQVDFGRVTAKMRVVEANSPLEQALRNLAKSAAFKDLNEYRHCCTHRRQVFVLKDVEQITHTSSATSGYQYYDMGSKETVVHRYLCSNPWDVRPRVRDKRVVVEFNKSMLNKIERRLTTIVRRLP